MSGTGVVGAEADLVTFLMMAYRGAGGAHAPDGQPEVLGIASAVPDILTENICRR